MHGHDRKPYARETRWWEYVTCIWLSIVLIVAGFTLAEWLMSWGLR